MPPSPPSPSASKAAIADDMSISDSGLAMSGLVSMVVGVVITCVCCAVKEGFRCSCIRLVARFGHLMPGLCEIYHTGLTLSS